jgi:putative flavoprotein involved in K+ transport
MSPFCHRVEVLESNSPGGGRGGKVREDITAGGRQPMDRAADELHDVVVIGAGQSGLAAGHYLAKQGLNFVILEAEERIGEVWRMRYDSLRLYSPAKGDALPGLAFPLPRNAFPTGRQMADYLEAYATHDRLPVRTGVRVARVAAPADSHEGFSVETHGGMLEARQVIVASGAFRQPRIPAFARELDRGIRQIHVHDYRGPEQLAPGPVLVVGLGHSGSDLAYEAALAGHRTIVSGRAHGELPFPIDTALGRHVAWPVISFLGSTLFTLRTPIGRRMAPRVRRGGGLLLRVRRVELAAAGVELRPARTVAVRDGRPALDDGSTLDVANVLWCTGYTPDYSWIEPTISDTDGWPIQRRGVVESVPGLYVLGVPFQFSFRSMLVAGAGVDARHVVDRVLARAAQARARGDRSPERTAA